MFSDRVIRKMEQRARHERKEALAAIHYADSLREDEDDEVTITDPETGTSLTFHFAHEGAYGRMN